MIDITNSVSGSDNDNKEEAIEGVDGMPMNLTGTNRAMRSQMVRVAQRSGVAHRVKKQETKVSREPVVRQPKKEPKDTFVRSSHLKKTHQRKTQQVLRRFVASTGNAKKAKRLQQKDTKEAKKAEYQREKELVQNKVPLDNASRIGLMYQQAMRRKRRAQAKVRNRTPQTQQRQLKRFLANLREYVNLEYKQYTRDDISLYSRRNLREILSALGHETKAFDNKIAKERRQRQSAHEIKRYNKHYAARASKHLKLFNEDPMQDPNYDPFEMIA